MAMSRTPRQKGKDGRVTVIPLYTLQGRGNWRAHGGKVVVGILKNRERALMNLIAAAQRAMP